MRLPAAVALLLLALPAPGRAEEWTTYTDREAGFSVSYPADWEAKSKPMPEATLKVQAPGDGAPVFCVFFHEKITGFETLTPEQGLTGYRPELILNVFRAELKDVVLSESRQDTLAEQAAAYLEASFLAERGSKGATYRRVARYFYTVANGGSYTATCEGPSDSAWSWRPVTSEMFIRFKILR